jgi:hypothetical protein
MQDNAEVPTRQNPKGSKGAGSVSKVKNKTSLKLLLTTVHNLENGFP